MPRLCEFYTGICLATEKKARENLSQGKKNLSEVKKNLNQSTVHILPKHPHITKLTHTHTIIFPKINYNLMKLYSYFNLKAVHPLVLTVETEIVFRLSYYTSGQLGSMFIILPVSSAVCLLACWPNNTVPRSTTKMLDPLLIQEKSQLCACYSGSLVS